MFRKLFYDPAVMAIHITAPQPKEDELTAAKRAAGMERGPAGSYPVSICVISTAEEFAAKGQGMLASLPIDAEVNVLLNKQGTTESLSEINELSEYPKLRVREWTYVGPFSFAEARNHAHDMATHDWVMWLDTDERMVYNQHGDIRQIVQNVPPGYGGIMGMQVSLRTIGRHVTGHDTGRGEYEAIGQCRIYRRSTGAKWFGRCHEQIADIVEQAGYRLLPTDVTVVHGGYVIDDRQALIRKLERNSELLLLQCAEMGKEHPMYGAYCEMLVRDMGGLIQLKKQGQ